MRFFLAPLSTRSPPMLIDVIAREAQARGLTCERADVPKGLQNKCVSIAGYPCQIVPMRLYARGKNSDLVLHALYLPRSDWPDFVIYALANGKDASRFFIVPRGEISKETGVCAPNNWLFKYENAWSLLSAGVPRAKLARRFDNMPRKLQVVIRKANELGLNVELIGKKNNPARHMKDRLYVNSCKCQVMSAGGLKRKAHARCPIIHIHPPKSSWADFLIFVVPSETVGQIFIIPRSKVTKTTSTTLTSPWLNEYADNWDDVKAAGTQMRSQKFSSSPDSSTGP
jgi:hypothetical protein